MGFADELAEVKANTAGPRCNVAILQETMTASDVAEMEAALADKKIPDSAVLKVRTSSASCEISRDLLLTSVTECC